MSVQLPHKGDKVYVDDFGHSEVVRILPNGKVEVRRIYDLHKAVVEMVIRWGLVEE